MKLVKKIILSWIYKYLPFIILFLVLLMQVLILTAVKPFYTYDETILVTISRQPLALLFNTLLAEPHPPGLYLLLKLLPTTDIFLTHLTGMVLNVLLLSIALIYGYKSKVMESYDLVPGVSLVFTTVAFFLINSNIKQEFITLPLLMLAFFIMLNAFLKPAHNRFFTFTILCGLSLIIFCFGYIFYAISMLCCLAVLVSMPFKKGYIVPLAVQASCIALYGWFFGFHQLLINTGRFNWFDNNFNSFFRTLSIFVTGAVYYNVWADIIVVLLMGFLGVLVYHYAHMPKKKKLMIGITALSAASLIALYYFGHFFVRPRYVFPLFFLFFLLVGWGIRCLAYYIEITIGFTLALLITNGFVFYASMTSRPTINDLIATKLEEISNDAPNRIGLLDEHPLFPYVFKINHPELKKIVPLNIFMPDTVFDYTTLTQDQIASDGKFKQLTDKDYRELLKRTGLTDFAYIMLREERPSYYDPHRDILSILTTSCELKDATTILYFQTLFTFSHCQF